MDSKKLKSLTWKYFWQQKFTEVGLFLLIVTAIVFIPYLLGHNIGNNAFCVSNNSTSWNAGGLEPANTLEVSFSECQELGGHLEYFGPAAQWVEGVFYICVLAIILFVITFFIMSIYEMIRDWLRANWKRAEKRAKEELKGSKR